MAGGIFTSRPFQFNIKCVAFGSLLASGYWWTASSAEAPSWLMVANIYIISYISMAWYDYYYSCDAPLLTGSQGVVGYIDSIWKPQITAKDPVDSSAVLAPSQQCAEYTRHVWLFQGLVTAPLLLYLSWNHMTGASDLSFLVSVLAVSQMIWVYFKL